MDQENKAPEAAQEITTQAVETKEADGVLDVVEEIVEQVVEVAFDKLFEESLVLIKQAIPGEQFDGIATVLLTQMKPHLKKGVLALVDKIDKKVG